MRDWLHGFHQEGEMGLQFLPGPSGRAGDTSGAVVMAHRHPTEEVEVTLVRKREQSLSQPAFYKP
jgi:hypothetical protein